MVNLSLNKSQKDWGWIKAKDFMLFNPKELVKKGTIVKNIPMDKIEPKTKEIPSYELTEYKGGVKFRNGDTLMARITPCLENGKISQVSILDYNEIGAGSTEFIVLREKEGISDKDFIYYLSNSEYFKEPAIKSMVGSSGRQRVQRDVVENLDIYVPPLDTQKKIGILLSLFDKKISLNKKINKNLYNIIEARFKHYVKDFSNLDKVVLSDYCNDIIRGFNSKYVEKSNLINLNQKVNKGDILEKQYFKYLNDDIEVPKEKFAKRKDVLLNSLGDGTLGRVHYYNENTDNVIIDQHITIIRSDENKLPSSYIYQYLKCGAGQYHLNSLISGSTGMLMLNISHIRNLELPILPQKELFEFDNFAKDLFDKISSNTKEIEKLQKLRDTLLPKLMSGEIDVSKINCDLELKYNYMKYLFNQIYTQLSKSVV